jgi:4-hydroxy-3-polyprenylbenzoate decarboxylase
LHSPPDWFFKNKGEKMRRVIIAITGASGVIYGIRALELLRAVDDVETHAIITPSAFRTALAEVDYEPDQIKALADHLYNHKDIGAAISSGSFHTNGMLVAPCSIKTLSAIANCYNEELTARAADVCLKERRRVVLMLRETPFHAGHIRLMDQATQSGAIIMPPVPGFYAQPQTLDDVVNQSVGRALDLLDIQLPTVKRWMGSGVD